MTEKIMIEKSVEVESDCPAVRRILKEEGIALVAVGAPGCIRSAYLIAKELGRLEQFCFCTLSQWDYAGGYQDSKIAECVQRALCMDGIRAVIIYPSCMEVLSGWTQEGVEKKLDNPMSVPLFTLFRGPMVKRRVTVMEELDAILQQVPSRKHKSSIMAACDSETPPQEPDYCGVLEVLESYDCETYLLTPGGCISCAKPSYYTRIYDVQMNRDLEESIGNQIAATADREKLCCLVCSPALYTVGVDFDKIVSILGGNGVRAIFMGNTGFSNKQEGISKAILKLKQVGC